MKYAITMPPSNCTLGPLFQKNKNLCLHKNLYVNVHSSFIHNSPKPEPIQKSFNRWMLKQTWDSHTMEHYSAIKGYKLLIHTHIYNLYGPQGNYAEWGQKKVNLKGLYTVWFHLNNILKWQYYRDGEQISGCQGYRFMSGVEVGRIGVVIKGQQGLRWWSSG